MRKLILQLCIACPAASILLGFLLTGAFFLELELLSKQRVEFTDSPAPRPEIENAHHSFPGIEQQRRNPSRPPSGWLPAGRTREQALTQKLKPGTPAPPLQLERVDDETPVELGELLGSRPVVLLLGSFT